LDPSKLFYKNAYLFFFFIQKSKKKKNILGHEEISSRAATNQNARRIARLGIF
jgi:hypothetical protein